MGEMAFLKFHAEPKIIQQFTIGAPKYGECYFTTTSGNRLDFYQTHFYSKPGELSSNDFTFGRLSQIPIPIASKTKAKVKKRH